MDFTALQTLLASLAALQQQVVDAQALVDQAYHKGFEDGVASVSVPPTDKLYSEEELQAKIKEALFPLEEKVSSLEAEIALVPQKIADAVAAFKADLLVKVKEVDAIEDKALEELLK